MKKIILLIGCILSLTVFAGADSADISKRIYLEVDIPKEIFVNEKAPVTVKFYSDWLDIDNLVVSDARSEEYISNEYTQGESAIVEKEGVKFVILNFNKWISIPGPGEIEFGPVTAEYDITKKKDAPLNDNETFYNDLLGKRALKHFSIKTETFKVKVMPQAPAVKAVSVVPPRKKTEAAAKPKKEIIEDKKIPVKLYRMRPSFVENKFFFVLLILPLIFLSAAGVIKKRQIALRAPAYAEWYYAVKAFKKNMPKAKALIEGNAKEFYEYVFRLMQNYPGGSDNKKTRNIFLDCRLAIYGSVEFKKEDMKKTFGEMAEAVAHLNKKRDLRA